MIGCDFIHIPASCGHAQEAAHKSFIDAHSSGDVTHSGRPVGLPRQFGLDQSPDFLLILGELDLMLRPSHPRTIERNLPCHGKLLDCRQKQRRRQDRFFFFTQLLKPNAGQIRPLSVVAIECRADVRLQPAPGAWQ